MSVEVLIVEDEPMVGHAIQRGLRVLQVSSRLVLSPSLIEAALEEEQPRLLICDLHMPGRSGIEVLTMARERFPLVRRCLLSGTVSEFREADVALIQPSALLRKPWSPEDLRLLGQSIRESPP